MTGTSGTGGEEAQAPERVAPRSKRSGGSFPLSFWVQLGQVLASLYLVLNVSQDAETNKP